MSGMYSVGISYAGRVITKLFFIQVLRMSGMYSVGISYAGRVITKLFFIQVLRMSGMYSVGMSYAGTGNNKAILYPGVENVWNV